MKKTKTLVIIGLVLLMILTIGPASAELKTIGERGIVFTGEEHLIFPYAEQETADTVGWWVSEATVSTTPPTKSIQMAGNYNDFSISPADFHGHTGYWHKIDPVTGLGMRFSPFTVRDPYITMDRIQDINSGNYVTDGSDIPVGTNLRFYITTNIFVVSNRPNVNPAVDKYVIVKVTKPDGTTISLADLFIDKQPFSWENYIVDETGSYSIWAESTLNGMNCVSEIRTFTVGSPVETPTATPEETVVPTGNIEVKSTPSGATIFLDNAIKGITPLTIYSVPNGGHTITLRLDNYEEYETEIVVSGEDEAINVMMLEIPEPTTIPTTIPTTVITTTPTPTPVPTVIINYSATIEAMQTQINDQETKISLLESLINAIISFLGL